MAELTALEKEVDYFLKVTLPDMLNRIDTVEKRLEEISWKKSISAPKEVINDETK